jgi:hypothetical protein
MTEPTREQLYRCVTAIALECWPHVAGWPTPLTAANCIELPKYVAAQIERLELTLAEITKIREKLETLA